MFLGLPVDAKDKTCMVDAACIAVARQNVLDFYMMDEISLDSRYELTCFTIERTSTYEVTRETPYHVARAKRHLPLLLELAHNQ
jgi:hypothetical protein